MREFELSIPEKQLEDLQARLEATRWLPTLTDEGGRGVSVKDLQDAVGHWLHRYDWRTVEAEINAQPNFITEINGATIHFQHHRSRHAEATPILLTHGWPGAFTEFRQLVPLLTDPTAHGGTPEDAFHVVIPSLPGFTLSTPMNETGWDVMRIASTWQSLMSELGYDDYYAQGGDAGSPISTVLSLIDGEHMRGLHLNMLMTFPNADDDPTTFSAIDQDRLAATGHFMATQSAYMQVMASSPLTISHGLADSPAGLLAWMLERFRSWADPRKPIDLDDILTIVSLYWFTNSAASSSNFYYEGAEAVAATLSGAPVPASQVAAAVSVFPYETFKPLRGLAPRALANLAQWTEHDCGGHFAAMEVPELLCQDLRAFKALTSDETPSVTAASL